MGLGLPDVRVRLTAEGEAQVVNALRKVVGEAQRAGRAAARGFSPFNVGLAGARGLLGQIASAAAVAGFVAIAKRAADAADEVGKMSQRVGASVENLSALGLVAKTSDVDMQGLTRTMVFLSRRVAELQGGSREAARDFGALGLTARDFRGKDAAQQLDLVASAMGRLRDSPEKTALGFRVLGKNVAEVIPLLNSLSGEGGLQGAITRARELGVLLSEDTARAAQAINDDLTIIKEQVLAGAARFVEGFAPALHAVFADVQQDLGQNQDAWKEWGETVGRTVGLLVLTLGQLFDRIGTSIAKISNALGAMGQAVLALFRGHFNEAILIEREARERGTALEAEFQKRQREREQRAERLGFAIQRGAADLPALRPGAPDRDAQVLEDETERKRRDAEARRLEAERRRQVARQAEARFNAQTAAGEQALTALAERRAIIEQQVSLGVLSQSDAARQVKQANEEALPVLQDLYRSYALIAAANPFDAEAAQRVREFGAAVRELEVEVAAADNLLGSIGATAKDAFKQALVDALTTGLQEAQNLLEVLRNIGFAVVQAIQQLLSVKLAGSIVGALPFWRGGRVERRAAGGPIEGPGTSTSDSVPALLSRGEYVVRAAAVQQPGVLESLEAINRGMAAPVLAGSRGVRRFADGGFVSGAGVTPSGVNVTLGLEDGLVAKRIESEEGSRAIVRVMSKNRRAVSSALGG